MELHSGEILGIAGVEGNGQDILIRAILDGKSLDKKTFSGRVHLHSSGSHTAVKGVFPEDRLRFGAIAERPAYENFILGRQRLAQFSRFGFLRFKNILKLTTEAMQTFDVRPVDEKLKFGSFSGGNQQKLVVARELQEKIDFLLAAQPTRGVDIGAIEFIHGEIRECRDKGAGVLLISSELDELMALSDRILVIYKGQIVADYLRPEFSEITIGKAMGGLL
jgi:simple sugar transport system ATP-binding protein